MQYSCPVTTVQRTWQAIDSALNVQRNSATTTTAAATTETTTDDTAVQSVSTSNIAKALQCLSNDDEQHVMWCIRVWTCATSSRTVSVGVMAAVACMAALSSSTPTCRYCNSGDNSSGSGGSNSNTGNC
jgi:hypothetical protein